MLRRAFAITPRLAAAAAAGAGATAIATHNSTTHARRQPLAPDDPTRTLLDEIYTDMSDGDEISIAELREIDASGGHAAYGELSIRGMRELRPRLDPQQGDVFYDLGSGTGRAVIQAALEWPVERAVGVELAASRNTIGEKALARVADASLRRKVDLRVGDIIECKGCEDASLVYVASLLFDDPFMSRLGQRLSELPKLRRVAVLTRFPESALPGFVESAENAAPDNDPQVRRERLEVTWGAARVYLYEKQ